ncbi:MAG: response regulator [Pseudomonadota bacterium]
MVDTPAAPDLADSISTHLPFLRRYARALTGAQSTGDTYAMATLEAIVADPTVLDDTPSPKVGLFRTFHKIWSSSGAPIEGQDQLTDLLEARAQWRLQHLALNTREALLLRSVEGFTLEETATIMNMSQADVAELYARALADMGEMVAGKVLIIEDEGIIAMDLKSIVSDMGHTVVDVARTKTEAVEKGKRTVPDLILADIQLADKSSGIDAVNALFAELGERPVIFITAFPERLLTGQRPEPAFLITKPYVDEQVRVAVSQAMFFATTEHMAQPA